MEGHGSKQARARAIPFRRATRGLAPAVLLAVCAAAQAQVPGQPQGQPQPAAPDAPALETVIVTGTHVKDRTELNSTVPVDILSAEDLRAAAGPEANLGQALQSLLPSFNYLDQSNSGSADHVRAAQLRGLNPDQLLVLINGKRVHTTSIVNVESAIGLGAVAVDFASIPVNAVKRIEVLRDGAGAQYGSDAVAGVIDVILDDAAGGELAADTGLFHTHFAPTDRTINDGQTVDLQGKYGIALLNGGTLKFGVDASQHEPTNRAGFDQFYPGYPAPTLVTFHVGDARIRNLNVWVNTSLPLSDGATGYSVILFNHRTSTGDAFFRESNDSSNYYTPLHPNGFLPQSTGTNEDVHFSGGIRGHVAGAFSYDGSFTYGLNRFSYGIDDSLNASYGAASPTSFDLGSFRFAQTTFNYDVTGDVNLPGLAAPSTLAMGVELRRETYGTVAGDPASYATGSYNQGTSNCDPLASNYASGFGCPSVGGAQGDAGLQPQDVANVARNVAGVYADLSGNLTHTVFADAGVRLDHYGDVGSAATGKLSARWEFAPQWGLRGAVSNNFRAPALAQIWSAYAPTTYTNGAGLGTVHIVPGSDPNAQVLGAQPLKPERSRNYSAGLTAQPLAQLQFSADFFRIDINDRIALSQQLFLQNAANPAGSYYEFFTNAVDTSTHGAELVANWTGRVLGGTLRLSDGSMWATNSIRDIHAQPPQINALGAGLLFGLQAQNAITTAVPRRRDVVTANWSGGGAARTWNLLARATRTGEVTRVFDFSSFGGGTPTQTYGATVQLDVEAEYHATRDLALALGAQNLTDRYPTPSDSAINYGGNLPYDFLSPIGFNGRYLYLRARYQLR
jgi:iron complex outermembrane receptor protein